MFRIRMRTILVATALIALGLGGFVQVRTSIKGAQELKKAQRAERAARRASRSAEWAYQQRYHHRESSLDAPSSGRVKAGP